MVFSIMVVLGLCLGSFVNALVWRLHEQAKKGKKAVKPKDLSVLHGRSMCVHCHHTLAWYDLLPVISWVSLGGKCRYCRKSISAQYPLVELLTGGLFVLSYLFVPSAVPFTLLFVLWLVTLVGFVALMVYDLRWMLLPDRIVYPLIGVGIAYTLISAVTHRDILIASNALLGVLCSAGLFYALYQVSKGKWIGGGDVKLAVVLGLILGGPIEALLMLFIASWLGSLYGLPLILKGKSKSAKIPFGPFLIIATIIVFLFGARMLSWYNQQFLFL